MWTEIEYLAYIALWTMTEKTMFTRLSVFSYLILVTAVDN